MARLEKCQISQQMEGTEKMVIVDDLENDLL